MSDTKINQTNESRRNLYRPDRVLTPNRMEKSPFQKLLDETSQNPDSPFSYNSGSTNPQETREAVRPVLSQEERYGGQKDDFQKKMGERELDREEGKTETPKGPGTTRAREAERRVIARNSVSDQRRHGKGDRGGSQEGHAGNGRRGRGWFVGAKGTPGAKAIRGKFGEATQARFVLETASPASGSPPVPAKVKNPNLLTKALLDQLVQYCRLVTRTDGDKEFDLQLHEEVFKGLRLRLSMVKGKIDVTFFTESEEVQGLFQAQKSEMYQALSQKGIDVKSINVIMV